jgi:hypothetical protein
MLWELVEWQRNPMELVEIKGISKRQKKPIVLSVEQYYMILKLLPQPYLMMGQNWSFSAPLPDGTSTRLPSSRTISVLPDAVRWSVQGAIRAQRTLRE